MNTEDCINKYLYYKDGFLFWKGLTRRTDLNDKVAGSLSKNGYVQVRINQKLLYAHRVVFFIHYGYWPKEVDHINRNKTDNRVKNLRACTRSNNTRNSPSKNFYIDKRNGNYRVRLFFDGKQLSFGSYSEFEFAELVAKEAREKYYGEWAYDY